MEITEKTMGDTFLGYWSPTGGIEVEKALTPSERAFVVAHEYYHSTDPTKKWWVRELKATLCPLWGFVLLSLRTLFSGRWLRYLSQRGQRNG